MLLKLLFVILKLLIPRLSGFKKSFVELEKELFNPSLATNL